MKFMLPLPPYHIIYLIVKLFRINLMLLRLEVLSSLDLSMTPLQLFHEFQTSLLLSKFTTKPMFLLNTMNFGVYFYPQPSRDYSPLIMQLRF
jgi:hypothetical protein